MQVTDRGAYGFRGVWATGPRRGALGAQHTLFAGPALMRHTIDAYDTRGFANITGACPRLLLSALAWLRVGRA